MTEPHRRNPSEGGDAPLDEEAVASIPAEAEEEVATPEDELPEEDVAASESETSLEDELEAVVRLDIDSLTKERDDYLDSLRRLQADFDNYRKRALRQQTDLLERAAERLIVQLLPVLDALDLAEAHAEGDDEQEAGALAQIGTLLRGTLEREGVERIDGVGIAFDPTEHDAVAHEEASEGDEPGSRVAEVMRAGYRMKGRVLRPAMVKVKG
jgi:molecular chaperone GrpE